MVRLRYCQEIVVNPGVAGIASHVFSANGMYDPDVTGIGHQPSGFDQNMLFFDHYTVIGSRISVKYFDDSATNQVPAYMDVLLTDNGVTAGTFGNVNAFLESRFAHGDQMLAVGTERNYNMVPAWRRVEFKAKEFFRKDKIVGASQYRGDGTQNPSEQAYFEVVFASINGTDPAPVNALVCIDYIAVLTEPKNIGQS